MSLKIISNSLELQDTFLSVVTQEGLVLNASNNNGTVLLIDQHG